MKHDLQLPVSIWIGEEKQLNSLTRNEIVQGISAKIFNRCKYPISSQVTPFVTKCFCFSPPHAV